MSITDYFLNTLIKNLQKIQKKRKKKRKPKRVSPKRRVRKPSKKKAPRKKPLKRRSKTASRKTSKVKRSRAKPLRKAVKKVKKKAVPKAKKKSPATNKKTSKASSPRASVSKFRMHPKKEKPGKPLSKGVPVGRPEAKPDVKEACVGEITHFFSRIKVVVVKMTKGDIRVGEKIRIKGRGTDLVQRIGSLQIESIDVKAARRGQLVGLKVDKDVKVGCKVYKTS